MPPLWLIGMMGSGKSTIGRKVAASRGVDHVDVDRLIESQSGHSISEIFESEGEAGFREREATAVGSVSGDVVVSTGGGVVLNSDSVARMRSTGTVVLLDASVPTLSQRVGDPASRPLLAGADPATRLEEIRTERWPAYEAAADYTIDADQTAADVARLAGSCDRFAPSETSRVMVGPVLPKHLMPASSRREQAVVVAQPGSTAVAKAVMARLEREVDALALVELPDREAAKNVTTVEELYDRLGDLNVGRHDTIVAVGGGTVTDAAGFAAATWLRGIEWVAIPTTMLGAVDASIGGKTGINVGGKNLVGAFWHPTQVSISTGVLDALDDDLTREGSAEAIKAGFIADRTIVDLYAEHGLDAPKGEVVRRAVGVKCAVVADDFRESGSRALLNFGHTLGHAIETVTGLAHGLAVSVGMVAAAEVSRRRHGFDPAELVEPLEALGLPTSAGAVDKDEVRELVARDKKRTADGIRMVLLKAVGEPVVEVVDADDIDAGLAAVGIA